MVALIEFLFSYYPRFSDICRISIIRNCKGRNHRRYVTNILNLVLDDCYKTGILLKQEKPIEIALNLISCSKGTLEFLLNGIAIQGYQGI